MIKAIIFDCFGVLTTDRGQALLDSLPENVDLSAANQIYQAYTVGIITRSEFVEQLKEIGGQVTIGAGASQGEIVKNTKLLEYIKQLKKDYKICLLSNIATPWITDSFLTDEEQSLFDAMILSFEVGITKPDPRIFLLSCERLRVGMHEAVLVDDNEAYCEAARREGLETVVYKDFKQMKANLEQLLEQKA